MFGVNIVIRSVVCTFQLNISKIGIFDVKKFKGQIPGNWVVGWVAAICYPKVEAWCKFGQSGFSGVNARDII